MLAFTRRRTKADSKINPTAHTQTDTSLKQRRCFYLPNLEIKKAKNKTRKERIYENNLLKEKLHQIWTCSMQSFLYFQGIIPE